MPLCNIISIIVDKCFDYYVYEAENTFNYAIEVCVCVIIIIYSGRHFLPLLVKSLYISGIEVCDNIERVNI